MKKFCLCFVLLLINLVLVTGCSKGEDNSAREKLVATWIDDDTINSKLPNVKEICDKYNIKCTFACISSYLESNKWLEPTLKEYKEEGFDIVDHSFYHNDIWKTNSESFSIDECEIDILNSIKTMNDFDFSTEIFVLPSGKANQEEIELLSRYYSMVINGDGCINDSNNIQQYNVSRVFIRPKEAGGMELKEYYQLIDSACNNGDWIVFGTYSGIETQWDPVLVENVINYAINKGFTFETASNVAKSMNYSVTRENIDSRYEELCNQFKFVEFDQGFVTFVFDDLRHDLDLVASIFEEYGFPLSIAAIPEYTQKRADGLTSDVGSFTPSMKMENIIRQVVKNGGEVMAHNTEIIINEDNQADDILMHKYFVESKENLEKLGFSIRGIMRTGGAGAISGTDIIESWLKQNYDFSNMGKAVNYSLEREKINQPFDDLVGLIDDAVQNKKWVRFMCHTLDGTEYKSEGMEQNYFDEDMLRNLLTYCKDNNIQVVTYSYMYDNYGVNR